MIEQIEYVIRPVRQSCSTVRLARASRFLARRIYELKSGLPPAQRPVCRSELRHPCAATHDVGAVRPR